MFDTPAVVKVSSQPAPSDGINPEVIIKNDLHETNGRRISPILVTFSSSVNLKPLAGFSVIIAGFPLYPLAQTRSVDLPIEQIIG